MSHHPKHIPEFIKYVIHSLSYTFSFRSLLLYFFFVLSYAVHFFHIFFHIKSTSKSSRSTCSRSTLSLHGRTYESFFFQFCFDSRFHYFHYLNYNRKQKEGDYDVVTGTRYAQGGGVRKKKIWKEIMLFAQCSAVQCSEMCCVVLFVVLCVAFCCVELCCAVLSCLVLCVRFIGKFFISLSSLFAFYFIRLNLRPIYFGLSP